MDLIKTELCGDTDNIGTKIYIKKEPLVKEEKKDLDIKSEETEENHFLPKAVLMCKNHFSTDTVKLKEERGVNGGDDIAVDSKQGNSMAVEEQELLLKPEEVNIKTDLAVPHSFQQDGNLVMGLVPPPQPTQLKRIAQKKVPLLTCHVCGYKTRHRSNLRQHAFVHKGASEVTMYKCPICAYETPLKGNLKQHSLVHSVITTVFNCKLCAYKSVRKANLKQHMLTHRKKTASDVTMHKCEVCLYETPRKGNLKQHMLIHKGVANLKMHKCEHCAYETPHKSNLNLHELVHKTATEVKMYKCDICTYKSKRKSSVKWHMLVHKSPAEDAGYTCEMGQGENSCEDRQDSK